MNKRLASAILVSLLSLVFIGLVAPAAWARTEVNDDGTTPQSQGEHEAQKYFRGNRGRRPASDDTDKNESKDLDREFEHDKTTDRDSDVMTGDTHYMALHIGGFLSSDSFQWGASPHISNTGNLTAGLTYRMNPLGRLADWALRVDFIGYTLPEGKSLQVAFLPLLLFPESSSKFPIYFGIGAGLGIFPTQLPGESVLGIHYQLLAGVRFFNVLGSTGFFLETGLKNHFFLLSDGQFNGLFLTAGALFTF